MSAKIKEEKPILPIDLVRKGSAPKLSPQAKDELAYEIGIHAETKQVHLRIAANGTGGYFSDEWIPLETIEGCFGNAFNKETPFSSTILRPAFVQGKSANNAGFLAAVMRKERLLSPHEKSCFKHLLTGDLGKWKQQQLAGQPKTPAKQAVLSKS